MTKLYHFTAAHLVRGCLQEGLTMGCIPVSINPTELIRNYQWLTKNKSFVQDWQTYSSLPYRRNAYRIVIDIPRSESANLIKWLDFCKENHKNPKIRFAAGILNSAGDPENWYLFHGIVKKEWFRKVSRNPG